MIKANLLSDSLAAKVASEVVYSKLQIATIDHLSNEIVESVSKELLDISVVYVEELKRKLFFEKLFKSLVSHEKKIGTMMIGIWEEQRKIIISNLKKMKKAWLEKDAVDQILYPRKQFEVKIAKESKKLFETLMEERGNEELGKIEEELRKPRKQVPIEVGFDVQNPNVQSWLNTYTPKFSNSLEAVSTSKLRTQLMQGIGAGEGIPELMARINGTYANWNKFRSESIARSEAIRASNQGAIESYRQSGVVKKKMWITHIDDKTCPSCRRLDGKVIALEKNFFNKGDPAERITVGETTHTFKNDYENITAPPRHTRCRCTIGASFKDMETSADHAGRLSSIAIKNEPRITRAMKGIASNVGATLEKLAFRLKTIESISRKLTSILKENPILSLLDAANAIQDTVRYTVMAPVKNFSSIVVKMNTQLKLKGFKLIKVTNYYGSKGAYQGINAKYFDPKSKLTFEVQYHTKQSMAIADKNHLLYEKARISTSPKVVTDLNNQMIKNWDDFEMPKDAPTLFSGK